MTVLKNTHKNGLTLLAIVARSGFYYLSLLLLLVRNILILKSLYFETTFQKKLEYILWESA